MNIIFLLAAAIVIAGSRYNWKGSYADYLDPRQTNAINGAFVMLVFMRHLKQYIECGKSDRLFFTVDGMLGQLIVTTFLFYSGYGIMKSIKNKENYAAKLPKRIARVWFRFALTVCLFLALNLAMGKKYGIGKILLSFLAWESIGNSTWYIFAILAMYASTYFAALLVKKNHSRMILVAAMEAVIYCILLKLANQDSWWYNTILCYPLGMAFAEFQKEIEHFLESSRKYWLSIISLVILMGVSYAAITKLSGVAHGIVALIFYEAVALEFSLLVVLISRKVHIGNPILDFLGKYTFEIYSLQRLPMILLASLKWNTYSYFAGCFLITILLAVIFRRIIKKI